ncbi:NAD(P)-dependent dehydrogenase, short-chain alcohol dehydrogenase family [Tranquillimonas rosea]|uniref:NAD(P)-dependent dehydrogenase, short-chain alcohol dehydrogenase family n=1 Tax=Tranquillimonas rosea TaxID=641238 RepID=A0A1H9QZD2_9RHOB|nr:SDR family oxidoreductase [Tranquillimonas rosea]SER65073.1 NAD(P)-dependent dehydrogenase, short-chain alcohol dehydrogenase family [Tranquillimonas rosea]
MTPPAIYPDLKNASVFITGGGSGIGAAITEGFLEQGARVAFVQRSDGHTFADVMEEKYGRRPLAMRCDVTKVAELRACVAKAAETQGPIRILVNNAANDQRHSTLEVDEAFWDWSMAINLKAYFFAAQAVIPGMQEAGGGAIVNMSSISYMMGSPDYPAYTTANAGITGMTRSLAREFGPQKIRVNALAPGWVLTEKQKEMWATPEGLEAHLAKTALKEHLEPRDMVGGILYLASDASRRMTGQCMAVDGGVVVSG